MFKSNLIIKNIGYMWHRDYVDWKKTSLIGYSEKSNQIVDFAYQAGIYALYNRGAEVIYVGQAGRGDGNGLFHRLKTHALEDELFCMWERFTWYGFYSSEVVNKMENQAWDNEFKIETDVNVLMNVIESMIIRINIPRFNKSVGSLKGEKENNDIEWFYQKAEIEDRESRLNILKERCASLR